MAPGQELNTIRIHSPHLSVVLERRSNSWHVLSESFRVAMEQGGRLEPDFEREAEASFNPRPARIALILLNDARVEDEQVLAAAVLAAAAMNDPGLACASALPQEVSMLARAALQSPSGLLVGGNTSASLIACAVHLDRARHRHLSKDSPAEWHAFLTQTAEYVQLAESCSPPLHILLAAWLERASRARRTEQ